MKDTVLWARQYSKRLITFLLLAWAFGAVIGAVYEFIRLIAAPEAASMDAFYIYLAVPLTCGIPSYVIPNIFLNKEKVKQGYIADYDQKVLNAADICDEGIGDCDIVSEDEGIGSVVDYVQNQIMSEDDLK